MLKKIEKKFSIAFILLFSIFFITPGVHAAPGDKPIANDYVNNPITTTGGDKPNIAVFVDNSPSMRVPIRGWGGYSISPNDNDPLNYGETGNNKMYFCDENAKEDNDYECGSNKNEIIPSNVEVNDVYKVIIYRGGVEDPAFIRVCEDIDDDDCKIDGEDIDDTTLKEAGTYLSPSTGIVYYYGNYLKSNPPSLNDVARAILVGEDKVSNYTTNFSGDANGDGILYPVPPGILQEFNGKARFKAVSFDAQGRIQMTNSYSANASSTINNLKSKNVNSNIGSLLNEVILIGICDDYMNKKDPWKRGQTYTPCRKSFILMITDGIVEPTDSDPTPTGNITAAFIQSIDSDFTSIGDWDKDGNEEGEVTVTPPDWLDDTAKFFFETDIQPPPDSPEEDPLPGIQNIRTYTVGFGVAKRSHNDLDNKDDQDDDDPLDDDIDALLKNTADNSGGKYFVASNPAQVASQIEAAINAMLTQAGSGTAVSVLATSGRGEGAAYQAIFLPLKQDADSGNIIDWMGFLQAYWVDSLGNLRQDDGGTYSVDGVPGTETNGDGKLVTSSEVLGKEDRIIQFIYTPTNGTVVKVGTTANFENELWTHCFDLDSTPPCISFEATVPIWEAGKTLAKRDMVNSPRNIYTFVDTVTAGECADAPCTVANYGDSDTVGEFLTFETLNASTLRPYLRAEDNTEAVQIMNYIRGENDYPLLVNPLGDPEPYRNRTIFVEDIDEPGGGTNRIWPFGDIVNSSPVAITAPTERYDKLYGNTEYASFYKFNKDRETVVYIGANDGMLHAFTGGKFDPVTLDFRYLAADVPNGSNKEPGTELWAYIPYDLLPHLKWLTKPTYNHIFYVDLKPKITDAQIFECDATDAELATALVANPNIANEPNDYRRVGENNRTHLCWGTILIGGMRFGGGQIDVKGDFSDPPNGTDEVKTFKSSFFALDITDPSKPPKLLWRFTDPNLGFTTSRPTVVKVGDSWFAVFGSGPDNSYDYDFDAGAPEGYSGIPDHGAEYDTDVTGKIYANIDTGARIFVVNLETGKLLKTFDNTDGLQPTKTFMGEPIVVDIDFKKSETYPQDGGGISLGSWNDEVVYIGETNFGGGGGGGGGGGYPWNGRMWRIVLTDNSTNNRDSADPDDWALTQVYDPGLPITAPPSSSMDKLGNPWLYFGTGRMYSLTDKENDPVGNQDFYGLKDICWDGTKMLREDCPDSDHTAAAPSLRNTAIVSTNVYDSTDVVVYPTGLVANAPLDHNGDPIPTFSALESDILYHWDGWKIDLIEAGERSITKPGIVGGLVFVTTVAIDQSGGDICGLAGEGFLYSLYFGTGTAFSSTTIGYGIDASGDNTMILKKTSLGTGAPAGVAVHIGEQKADNKSGTGGTVFIQDSTGKITQVDMTTAFSLANKIVNWQEVTD